MDYSNKTKEQLVERIASLEMLLNELLREKEQDNKLEYAWTGNLGKWYWNVKTNEVIFNPLKATTLGYDKSELPEQVPYQFFTEMLHPEDYENVMQSMLNHLQGEAVVYEVEYRIQAKDGDYKWYYDRGKITQYDKNGKPAFLAGIVFDITERKERELELTKANEYLSEISEIDELTKIGNTRSLKECLQQEFSKAEKDTYPISLAIFDIDDFKKVNDTKGHLFGNQVLVDVALIMEKDVRESDIVGRFGGEEFMIIFPNTNLKDAQKVSERIRKAIDGYNFKNGYKVTVSGGIAELNNETISEFIDLADRNLYEAKRKGKNQIFPALSEGK